MTRDDVFRFKTHLYTSGEEAQETSWHRILRHRVVAMDQPLLGHPVWKVWVFPVETKKTHRSRVIVVAKKGFQYVFSSLFIYLLFCWFDFSRCFIVFHVVSHCLTLLLFSNFLSSYNQTPPLLLFFQRWSALLAVHQIFDGCGQLRTGNFGQMCRKCIGF